MGSRIGWGGGMRRRGARFAGVRFAGARFAGARRSARAGLLAGRFLVGRTGFFRRIAGLAGLFDARPLGLDRPGRAAFRFFAI